MRLRIKRETKTPSQRPGFVSALRRELRDYYFSWQGDRIDGISLFLPISIGGLFGLLLSLTIETGETYLVVANTTLWAVIALAFMLAGAFGFTASITLGLVIVIGVELLRKPNHPRKARRRSIREDTRLLQDAVSNDRIPLQDLEKVRTSLRVRDEAAGRHGADWYERILVNRWRRQRERVERILEHSWQEALPEAIEYLREECAQMRRGNPSDADDTEVAWYLAYSPINVAVQRLLVEYLPAERHNGNGHLEFRAGVVYTPRWVYTLVRAVENQSHVTTSRRWAFSPYPAATREAIGNECAPLGDVDRETVEKLYEPDSDGPLGSIWETIETARNV